MPVITKAEPKSPARDGKACPAMTGRIFRAGAIRPEDVYPSWLAGVVDEFLASVGDREYPCHFGRQAYLSGDLFGTWLGLEEDLAELGRTLAAFLEASRPFPRRRMVLACFCEPEGQDQSHVWYADRFWHLLSGLRAIDARPWPDHVPSSPEDGDWEFCFHGTPMFVFAATPTHELRISRRLGPGMIVLFQPRNVFHGIEGGTPGGIAARNRIHGQLRKWDLVPPHPAMGPYGDPAHPEWRQYFIGDHDRPMHSTCPLTGASEPLLHDMVGEQVLRTPDALAVLAGGVAVDYRTLDRTASRLAGYLVRRGIGPEDRVGIIADRSADTVVAILAVLRAGAAYVPIDPSYPETRRAALLEDAGADVVVTPRRLVAQVPVGPRWLMLSDDLPAGQSGDHPPASVAPDNLAYVIYTSGSTGAPKGVAVSHRQITHAITAQHQVQRPWPEAFLLSTSFSFDASAVGLYWTLSAGGCVVIPADGEHNDPGRLRELIETYGVSHIDCPPSLYDLVLGTDAAPLQSLRCVQVGGEPCPPDLVARHRRLLPECVFENNYGPTETTIWSTTQIFGPEAGPRATADAGSRSGPVPIGVPIPGARVYLLDPSLRPVPPGAAGEICVGGSGVARGYLGRPGLTAEHFLPDSFCGRPGLRMYRTGDMARELPDGSLEFLGRRDSQVKLRGFRIELGEVESALRAHPDVAEAVVDVRAIAGEKVLVGYVCIWDNRPVSDISLISHLSPVLPDHMVPRRFVQVAQMPRTISGKVDRSRLPDPPRRSAPVTLRPVRTGAPR
jgi:amino acid adenylation domain-containing protein